MLLTLGIYIATIPYGDSLSAFGGDGGELITASYTLGIPHPPGYPLYVLLGKIFSSIPVGTIWLRYQLFSALAMAIGAGFATICSAKILRNLNPLVSSRSHFGLIAVVCGLTIALSPLVWHHAINPEVYGLNMAILSILIWMVLSDHSPMARGLLFGLSLTTHLTSIFILPLVLFHHSAHPRKALVPGFLIGLSPFLLLPLLANSNSMVRWGVADDFSGWLWLVSARIYSANVLAIQPHQWLDRIREMNPGLTLSMSVLLVPVLAMLINEIKNRVVDFSSKPSQFPFIVGINIYLLKQQPRPPLEKQTSKQSKSRSNVFLVFTLVAVCYGIYGLSYRPKDFFVILLPVFLLLTLSLSYLHPRHLKYTLVLPLIMIAATSTYFTRNNPMQLGASARELLMQVPADSIVLSPGDETYSFLTYLLHVEKVREDLLLVDTNLFQFEWYRQQISRIRPGLSHLENDHLTMFINSNSAKYPVCHIAFVTESKLKCSAGPYG